MSTRRRALIMYLMAITADAVSHVIQEINRESDDSEDDDLLFVYQAQVQCRKRKRKKVTRINGYINNVVPRYNTRQFRQHFRLTPTAFESILNKITPILSKVEYKGRPIISPHTQLLAILWLLATPDSYR